MSIFLTLEITDEDMRDEVFLALRKFDFEFSNYGSLERRSEIGLFLTSGMRVFYSDCRMLDWGADSENSHAFTIDESVEGWVIGTRLEFHYPKGNYDECDSEIKILVNSLNEEIQSNFVLAFQFEVVQAIKKDGIFRWVSN